ncbi:hypothetical protein [Brasilonema sp. UFV-L1]
MPISTAKYVFIVECCPLNWLLEVLRSRLYSDRLSFHARRIFKIQEKLFEIEGGMH